jgi:CPA2 family monovalent cation:H+ antiporter-2
MNPSLHILARTRFVSEVQALYDLGADDVVPEEFETSLEIFRRAAGHYSLPEERTEQLIRAIRVDHYQLLQSDTTSTGPRDPPGMPPGE